MALTPMMKQYFQVKDSNKDCIVFFRLGDFYEMFFEDAKIASRELELVLTGRDCGMEEKAPMCGVPFHSSKNYINRLVQKGYKVGICEQLEDANLAKGIVKRGIVKIYTPGTYSESSFLEETKNNFIMSIIKRNDKISISLCDVSTGEFNATEFSYNLEALLNEISKYTPKEILIEEGFESFIIDEIKSRFNIMFSEFPFEYFSEKIDENLDRYFKDNNNELSKELSLAINFTLSYIEDTQRIDFNHINSLNIYSTENYLSIDLNSRRNLELTESLRDKTKKHSLLWVMDSTNTAMGARELRKWIDQPLINKTFIENRLFAVEELCSNLDLLEDLKINLKDIYDIERLIGKISSKSVNAKEMLSLKNSLLKIPKVKMLLENSASNYLKDIYNSIDTLDDVAKLLSDSLLENPSLSIKEGNIIKKGFNDEIDRLKEAKESGKQWLANLENDEKEATGIKSLKISFNKVFGYYIEVTKTNLNLVPTERYVRKQTLSNCERYITKELKEMEETILSAEEKLTTLEYETFIKLRDDVEKQVTRMQSSAKLIAILDCIASLSEVALNNNYVKPEITTNNIIDIKDGRHPVIEKIIPINSFINNSVELSNEENQLLLITGPNMAGKSTYMRQCALITIMAQIGSFVPATKATIGICDKIFTRIGASDDLAGGKSTFMVEMHEVANILNNATNKSLVLLDEVGRGTSTYDGLSIAWSVIEYLTDNTKIKCKTLFATHYHELTTLENTIKGLKNFSVGVKKINDEIVFLHKIVNKAADESYGIEVAKLAGIPKKVIDRARDILTSLEEGTFTHKTTIKENISKEETIIDEKITYKKSEKDKNKEIAITQLNFDDYAKDKGAEELLKSLCDLDLMNMTPLDAMSTLSGYIKKAKKLL